jgi:hypothetical protein
MDPRRLARSVGSGITSAFRVPGYARWIGSDSASGVFGRAVSISISGAGRREVRNRTVKHSIVRNYPGDHLTGSGRFSAIEGQITDGCRKLRWYSFGASAMRLAARI